MKSFCVWFGNKLMSSRFINITLDILFEVKYIIIDMIASNLRNVAFILRTALPYLMWYVGISLYVERGKFVVGGEIFIPLLVFVFTYYIRQYANRIGKGEKIPIPDKRFTELGEEEGEYTVETKRIEEMILYMSNLEDWLQRKGLLK